MSPDQPPRRLLFLSDGLRTGGMERQMVELIAELNRGRRWHLSLAVLDPGGELEAEAVRSVNAFVPLRRSARYDLGLPFALIRRVRADRIDLIHAWGWMSGLAALLAGRSCRVPVVNGSIRNAPPRLSRRERISRWTAARSDLVVANSKAGLEAYRLAGHPRARVIYNGVDLARFDNVVAEPYPGPAVSMVGNFSRAKDQPLLIRAFHLVRKEIPGALLVLIGKDHGTLPDSRRLVEELGLYNSVRFMTDTFRPEPLLAGSRVCALASGPYGEGTSNAILESMALARPTVATECGGNSELVQDGVTGFLVPRGRPEIMAERILSLLRNEDLAESMGRSARARVCRCYSAARMAGFYEDAYRSLLPAPAGRRA